MKVYVTYNGDQIEKIFANQRLAVDWVIFNDFNQPLYSEKEWSDAEIKALSYIDEFDVVQDELEGAK